MKKSGKYTHTEYRRKTLTHFVFSFCHYSLQGLCKLGSAGGDDYSLRQFAEGSTEKLAKQCRK